jgi:MarR family transcriptional repressor of emrRAB
MNNIALQYRKLEANLARLQARMPNLPTSKILLTRLIMHLGRGMATMVEHEVRPFGLTEAEFRVLTTLFAQPEGTANPSDLCNKTSQSPANMSRICDGLVARDLISRVSSLRDRRKMVLRVTEQGEELVRRLLPSLCEPLERLFHEVSEAEQHALLGQLKLLAHALDQVTGQDQERTE